MIDTLAVTYILLSRAGRLLSTRPSPATLWRWAQRGIDGVKLRTYKIGGRRYTTAADLEHFVASLSAPRSGDMPLPTTGDQERKAVAAVRAEAIFGPANVRDDPSGRDAKGEDRPRKRGQGK